jgi:hypothetical protein
MQEFDLVITFTTEPNEKQLEQTRDFVKGYQLSNPQAKVTVITPRPPRVA